MAASCEVYPGIIWRKGIMHSHKCAIFDNVVDPENEKQAKMPANYGTANIQRKPY
jgi:hypothetical protein